MVRSRFIRDRNFCRTQHCTFSSSSVVSLVGWRCFTSAINHPSNGSYFACIKFCGIFLTVLCLVYRIHDVTVLKGAPHLWKKNSLRLKILVYYPCCRRDAISCPVCILFSSVKRKIVQPFQIHSFLKPDYKASGQLSFSMTTITNLLRRLLVLNASISTQNPARSRKGSQLEARLGLFYLLVSPKILDYGFFVSFVASSLSG